MTIESHIPRPQLAGRKILFLLNPGRMSRNWLLGMVHSCERLGIGHVTLEIEQLRSGLKTNAQAALARLDAILHEHRVGAVAGYLYNGTDIPGEFCGNDAGQVFRTYFELRRIPHLMLWFDHPHWAMERDALRPEMQPAFRPANCHHFFKNRHHANELNQILGWPNCHQLTMAADPDHLKPVEGVEPRYDVVAIYGGSPKLPDWFKPFLEQDDPDPREMNMVVADVVREEWKRVIESQAPATLHAELIAVCERLTALKTADPGKATARHLPRVGDEFPRAMIWLTAHYPTWFQLGSLLFKFRGWVREFVPAYLSKYFRVAVLGGDWSALGCAGSDWNDGANWVDFHDMPRAFAAGKVALSVVAGWDEEGLPAKTFETAASGAAIVHNDCYGLAEHFEIGKELEAFTTPKHARLQIQRLLDTPSLASDLKRAARSRVERDHSWDTRVTSMLSLAGLDPTRFRG